MRPPAACPPALQHFTTPDGAWPGGDMPFNCSPLSAWPADPVLRAGGPFNAPIAPLVPWLGEGHLRIFNATVPLWESHWAGECRWG